MELSKLLADARTDPSSQLTGGVRLLADALGLDRAQQVLEIAEAVVGDRLDVAARFFVEELFD
ncbi:hypothetical protein BH20ACT2_BH20ACT2_04110 [soil metagenome]